MRASSVCVRTSTLKSLFQRCTPSTEVSRKLGKYPLSFPSGLCIQIYISVSGDQDEKAERSQVWVLFIFSLIIGALGSQLKCKNTGVMMELYLWPAQPIVCSFGSESSKTHITTNTTLQAQPLHLGTLSHRVVTPHLAIWEWENVLNKYKFQSNNIAGHKIKLIPNIINRTIYTIHTRCRGNVLERICIERKFCSYMYTAQLYFILNILWRNESIKVCFHNIHNLMKSVNPEFPKSAVLLWRLSDWFIAIQHQYSLYSLFGIYYCYSKSNSLCFVCGRDFVFGKRGG